nr:GAF domain-containing protein [Streptomyces seoulensis]
MTEEEAARAQLLAELGLELSGHSLFDEIAEDLGKATGFLYGFVNLFGPNAQHFTGLFQPLPEAGHPVLDRSMRLDHGWCPDVVRRKKSLPLHDVHAAPRFSGNPVVDAVGIRSYYGSPLIHPSGVPLGTVCVADPEKRKLEESTRLRDLVAGHGERTMKAIMQGAHLR